MGKELENRSNPQGGISSALMVMSKVRKQTIFVIASLALLGILLFAMTAAWYTNVAETTGLVFETESWGFEGLVKVQDETPLTLAPGESGVVNLSITNDGDQINAVSVSVDKAAMSAEMQKRVYFYVPAVTQENGETMDRVYVSPFNGYTYNIMPKTTLMLTEDVTTAMPLCCEWVYDVLGYYVYGTVNSQGLLSEDSADGPVYIRPVVYDYEKATYSATGELLTVDGATGVTAFLTELSRTDGYERPISQIGARGRYYPILVEEDGVNQTATGLWVYLCTQGEIDRATQFDTALGSYMYRQTHPAADPLPDAASETDAAVLRSASSTATICIGGQNARMVTKEVATTDALIAAAENPNATGQTVIQLMNDVTLARPLSVPEGSSVVLDLNGKTLTSTGTQPVIETSPGSSMTLMGGTVDGQDRSNAILAMGSQLAISDVTVKGRLRIEDSAASNTDALVSVVSVSNSTILADGTDQVGIMVLGNGDANSQKTALLVQNSTVDSTYVGILGNGSSPYYGTNIQVINSHIKGTWGGIYQPQQDSHLVVSEGSVVEGFTGLILKGGSALIKDSTVMGTAAAGDRNLVLTPTAFSKSGYCDTGAGVYVEANYGWPISFKIAGGSKISSLANEAILILGDDARDVVWEVTDGVQTRSQGQF